APGAHRGGVVLGDGVDAAHFRGGTRRAHAEGSLVVQIAVVGIDIDCDGHRGWCPSRSGRPTEKKIPVEPVVIRLGVYWSARVVAADRPAPGRLAKPEIHALHDLPGYQAAERAGGPGAESSEIK